MRLYSLWPPKLRRPVGSVTRGPKASSVLRELVASSQRQIPPNCRSGRPAIIHTLPGRAGDTAISMRCTESVGNVVTAPQVRPRSFERHSAGGKALPGTPTRAAYRMLGSVGCCLRSLKVSAGVITVHVCPELVLRMMPRNVEASTMVDVVLPAVARSTTML